MEALFNCFPESNAPEPYLTCFNDGGKLLWEFHPSGTVADTAGREFRPPFFVNDFEVVQLGKSDQSKIVVACNHYFSFPAQVVMLDSYGKLLNRYWHGGETDRQDREQDQRIEQLKDWAKAWAQAERLRAFLSAWEKHTEGDQGVIESGSQADGFRRWVALVIDEIDPLI